MILTNENYFSEEANREYMSVSQFKAFQKCEAAAMAELRGEYTRPKTTALLVGSYIDSWFEGTLDIFKKQNPEIFTTKLVENPQTVAALAEVGGGFVTRNFTLVAKKIKEAKETYPHFFTEASELKADYTQAEQIIERVQMDKLFMEYMAGEKQRIFTASLFGTPWKVKVDSLLPDKMVDLKIMRTLERIMGQSFITHWGYDIQGAVYQAVEGGQKPFYIAAATKEDPTDLEIIHVEQYQLDEALSFVEKRMPHILAVKLGEIEPERCGVCPHCRATKVLTAPISSEDVGFSAKQLREMRGEYQ